MRSDVELLANVGRRFKIFSGHIVPLVFSGSVRVARILRPGWHGPSILQVESEAAEEPRDHDALQAFHLVVEPSLARHRLASPLARNFDDKGREYPAVGNVRGAGEMPDRPYPRWFPMVKRSSASPGGGSDEAGQGGGPSGRCKRAGLWSGQIDLTVMVQVDEVVRRMPTLEAHSYGPAAAILDQALDLYRRKRILDQGLVSGHRRGADLETRELFVLPLPQLPELLTQRCPPHAGPRALLR